MKKKFSELCRASAGVLILAGVVASVAGAESRPTSRELTYYQYGAGKSEKAVTVIGSIRLEKPLANETFADLARRVGLGYNELLLANPDVDPWLIPESQQIIVPGEWILPAGARTGLVMNIPEMRLYYYTQRGGARRVVTFPVGLGRQEWQTPRAAFRISGKTKSPTWVIPESIRKEMIEQDGSAPYSIAGGLDENPLGDYRIELTLPSYAIHGTNKAYGVGMQVSHGCVRMYPEHIEALFPAMVVGTQGHFLYETVKVGLRYGRILIEVHPDIYGVGVDPRAEAARRLRQLGMLDRVDPLLLRAALAAKSGFPTDIGRVSWDAAVAGAH
jgi:L,D-transpeptidase ErfK/SrfK